MELAPASELLERWIVGTVTDAEERDLFDNGEITECEYEFGPHDEHDECDAILARMSGGDIPDDRFNTVDEFGQTSWED